MITPTATTCSLYRDGTPPTLPQVQYTTKGAKNGLINAVSPGVFFYYTKVSGDAGADEVAINQDEQRHKPGFVIPVQQGADRPL